LSEVVVIAELSLVEGREEEALAALETLCRETHAKDDGCQLYACHRVKGSPTAVVFIEKWDSAEALQKHAAADHLKEFRALDCIAPDPKLTFIEPVGFGGAEKGAL